MKDDITATVEETEARQRLLFSELKKRNKTHNLRVCRCCMLFIELVQSSPQFWTHTHPDLQNLHNQQEKHDVW